MLVSDEIYDEFTYADALEDGRNAPPQRRLWDQVLMIRGMGKTYGCTGWRLGYAAGPTPLIEQMTKLQQFTFVCAPSMAQRAFLATGRTWTCPTKSLPTPRDASSCSSDWERRPTSSNRMARSMRSWRCPSTSGLTATEFAERAVERGVLVIPGNVFSSRKTAHFRLSYAVEEEQLAAWTRHARRV